MPIYALKCDGCGNKEEVVCPMEERNEQPCSVCGSTLSQDFSRGGGSFHPFREGWYEHIAPQPLYISSMKDLERKCDEHGVVSKYVEDSR